jgi:diguanylate cyclase (GGDEF)-like protein
MRILVAEDDPTSLLILRRALERLGHQCVAAKDGHEAWEQYLAEDPDVLITDWMMPGIDGPELVARIRDAPGFCYVVMLTALAGDEHALAGMSAGADGYLSKPLDITRLRLALVAAERMTQMHRRLADREAELTALNARLAVESRLDSLTGLGNRLSMREGLARLGAAHRRYCRPYALALVDVDHFKAYNDRYGHQAGDRALRQVADTLVGGLRGTDHVFRYGGEELLVALPEQDADAAHGVMDRLRRTLADAGIVHELNPPSGVLTISVGVAAVLGSVPSDVEAVLGIADQELYAAKAAGRNRVSSARAPAPAID